MSSLDSDNVNSHINLGVEKALGHRKFEHTAEMNFKKF